MRNGKKEYRVQGLVVDAECGRYIACQIFVDKYSFINILSANRWMDRMIVKKRITRKELVEYFAFTKIVRVLENRKVRIVCS